jgi:uncharacterized LabA/DUF88 family protein
MVKDLHTYVGSGAYDNFVIVSGNGQFLSCINAIHSQNKKVTVMSFKTSLQQYLQQAADEVILLDNTFLYDENKYKKAEIKQDN